MKVECCCEYVLRLPVSLCRFITRIWWTKDSSAVLRSARVLLMAERRTSLTSAFIFLSGGEMELATFVV